MWGNIGMNGVTLRVRIYRGTNCIGYDETCDGIMVSLCHNMTDLNGF